MEEMDDLLVIYGAVMPVLRLNSVSCIVWTLSLDMATPIQIDVSSFFPITCKINIILFND